MAVKKFKFPVCVVVHDPSQDVPELRDPHTQQIVRHFTIGTRMVPAGELVEVDEAEAARIYGLHGSWENYEIGQRAVELSKEQERRTGGRTTVIKSADVTFV